MYIKVCFCDGMRKDLNDYNFDPPCEILINPDCPVRMIYSFLRKVFQVDSKYELDLSDIEGNLLFLNDKDPWTSGLSVFKERATYYMVLLSKDGDSYALKPLVKITDAARGEEQVWTDIISRIKKQLKFSKKPSKTFKNRAGVLLKQ